MEISLPSLAIRRGAHARRIVPTHPPTYIRLQQGSTTLPSKSLENVCRKKNDAASSSIKFASASINSRRQREPIELWGDLCIRGAGSAAQANHYNQIVFSLTLWALGRSPQQLNCSTGDSATQSQQSLVKMFRLGKLFSAAPGLWSVAEPWSKSSIKREAIGQFQAPKPRSTYLVASVFGSNYWFVYTH